MSEHRFTRLIVFFIIIIFRKIFNLHEIEIKLVCLFIHLIMLIIIAH